MNSEKGKCSLFAARHSFLPNLKGRFSIVSLAIMIHLSSFEVSRHVNSFRSWFVVICTDSVLTKVSAPSGFPALVEHIFIGTLVMSYFSARSYFLIWPPFFVYFGVALFCCWENHSVLRRSAFSNKAVVLKLFNAVLNRQVTCVCKVKWRILKGTGGVGVGGWVWKGRGVAESPAKLIRSVKTETKQNKQTHLVLFVRINGIANSMTCATQKWTNGAIM